MRRVIGVLLVLLLGVTALAACGDDDDDTKGAAGTPTTAESATRGPVTVRAGANDTKDPNVAVLQFLPATITVKAGEPVDWIWTGTEAHSVTFLKTGTPQPSPEQGTAIPVQAPTGPYDGSTTINSGLQLKGPGPAPKPFEVTFAKAGTYGYFCVIHPLMTGQVKVVESGGDTAASVRDRGDRELDKWLAEGRAAKKKLTDATPTQTKNADGSTTWHVQMGAGTPHTAVLAFAPTPAEAKVGDTVTFVNGSTEPHTATFNPAPALATAPESPDAMKPSPGPSPQSLADAKAFLNTGWLPPDAPPGQGPPLPARSFSVKFTAAGDYSYVCLLHALSGMTGTVKIS